MNELDILIEIQKIARDNEKDAEKVLKGNKSAGIRLRKKMQMIRTLAKDVRIKVQDRKRAQNE